MLRPGHGILMFFVSEIWIEKFHDNLALGTMRRWGGEELYLTILNKMYFVNCEDLEITVLQLFRFYQEMLQLS